MGVEIFSLETIDRAFVAENLIEADRALESPEFRALIASTDRPTKPLPDDLQKVVDKLIAVRTSL